MRFRDPEAARIENDYFLRLGTALSRCPAEQRNEILQNVREHVQLALGEGGTVSLVEMAGVLQRLGSPETVAAEATGGAAPPSPAPEPQSARVPPPVDREYAHLTSCLTPDQYPQATFILRRLWIAAIIGATGIFIPVTGPGIATLVASIIIATTVLAYRGGLERSFRTVGQLEVASIVLELLVALAMLLYLGDRSFGLLVALFGIPQIVCGLVSYWKMMTVVSGWTDSAGRTDIGSLIRQRRLLNLCVCVPAVLILAIITSAIVGKYAAPFVLLPVHWLTGWYFSVQPLRFARDVIDPIAATPQSATAS